MKTKLMALMALPLATLTPQFSTAHAQGTAFTYSGRLNNGANPANGLYDLTFSLLNVSSGGSALAGPLTNSTTGVTNGLFTVTLDFGNVFNGASRWLEIGVRTNGPGAFNTLTPRQPLLPTPYAIFANSASNLSGVVSSGGLSGAYSSAVTINNPANLFSGSFTGNGGGLTNLNVSLLGGLAASNYWQTTGNGGTMPGPNFLGTTDFQALELQVNTLRALRLEPTVSDAVHQLMVNVIGGSSLNFIPHIAGSPIYGATIAGGGGFYLGSNLSNAVYKDFGTIGGGASNVCIEAYATVGGGEGNLAGRDHATVPGGLENEASGKYSFAGGSHSLASSDYAVALGSSKATATFATALGVSTASGLESSAAGDSTAAGTGATGLGVSTAGGDYSTASGNSSAGGNYSSSSGSAEADGLGATAMGYGTYAYGDFSTAGGVYCTVNGSAAVVSGGSNNITSSDFASIGGGKGNSTGNYYCRVGGGKYNNATGTAATIGGGILNYAAGWSDTVAGGQQNSAKGLDTGGDPVDGPLGYAIGGACTVGGGYANTATNFASTISGGANNYALGYASTVCGGNENVASISFATVCGGRFNHAEGQFSLAAGWNAHANHDRSFIWSSYPNPAPTFGPDTFFVSATNGVGINCGPQRVDGGGQYWLNLGNVIGSDLIETSVGAHLTTSGVWANNSDRNRKTDLTGVNSKIILNKLAALQVTTWRYTNELSSIRHIGPMAQDFHAAFGLGTDEKSIGTVDEEGVALAAIQGLNEKVEEKETRIQEQESRIQNQAAEIETLKKNLADLNQLVQSIAGRKWDHHEKTITNLRVADSDGQLCAVLLN